MDGGQFMKKRTAFLMTMLLLSIFLSSCGFLETKPKQELFKPSTEEIVQCFIEKDVAGLKAILEREMSSAVYDDIFEDIDKKINDAFDFIDGNIISYKIGSTTISGDHVRYGEVVNRYQCTGIDDVTTDTGKVYWLAIGFCSANIEKPSEVGISDVSIQTETAIRVIGYGDYSDSP
jgi:PBP1b-binding outer membrane lipoprotein LpoB